MRQRDETAFKLEQMYITHPILGLCDIYCHPNDREWEVTVSGVLLPAEIDVGLMREYYDDVVISLDGKELSADLLDSLSIGNETLEEYAIEYLLRMRDL